MNNAFTSTAEVIDDGEYQMVNLPEGFQFDAEEVWVKKIGNAVVLSPVQEAKPLEQGEVKQ